jgi:signal transduction histidine kinase
MASFFFIARRAFFLLVAFGIGYSVWHRIGLPNWIYDFAWVSTMILVVVRSLSHVHRVRLISGRTDAEALRARHRRQVELPFPADEAFTLVEAAIRELPNVDTVESARDSLQVHARLRRPDPTAKRRNLVHATVTPGERVASLTLISEPEGGAWRDWLTVDDGANLEAIEATTRAITRRVSERRKVEEAQARETASAKELSIAKLSLLHAQVEPHFLYNTLASAQLLTRSDPAKADRMIGNLIAYLRNSLPRADAGFSTVGEELEGTRAYLEILRIRMGERLALQIQVPNGLKAVPLPPMMLQTLAENAIKHGLEPMPGGGTIWILGREAGDKVSLTVADDGRGFSEDSTGTGIGLKNVRERLRLGYGDAAAFSIAANFPRGVAATLTVPRAGPGEAHG